MNGHVETVGRDLGRMLQALASLWFVFLALGSLVLLLVVPAGGDR